MQEEGALLLFFEIAHECSLDALTQIGGCQPFANFLDFLVCIHSVFDIGSDGEDANTVDTRNLGDLGRRTALDEITKRHEAHIGLHAQAVEDFEVAVVGGEASANVDLVV